MQLNKYLIAFSNIKYKKTTSSLAQEAGKISSETRSPSELKIQL